jgi:citrate synthase
MRIGKQDAPYSAICTSDTDSITVRGRDLVTGIIGKMDFTSYFWLLVTGESQTRSNRSSSTPSSARSPSTAWCRAWSAARMTYAAAPEALQGAVAAGLLGCGSVVLGSAEVAGSSTPNASAQNGAWVQREEAAREGIARLRADKKAIPGFGHPQHANGDPRANLLLELAGERGVRGRARRNDVRDQGRARAPDTIGRALPVNVNGPDSRRSCSTSAGRCQRSRASASCAARRASWRIARGS